MLRFLKKMLRFFTQKVNGLKL